MSVDGLEKLKGIVAILEYMASANKLDVKHTKEALGVLAGEMQEVLEKIERA